MNTTTQTMTPDKQRIAIAEACGYDCADLVHGEDGRLFAKKNGARRLVPDYPADLNAMHEAEKGLTAKQRLQYADMLSETTACGPVDFSDIVFAGIHATAAQRAEAFLRAIGKWVG